MSIGGNLRAEHGQTLRRTFHAGAIQVFTGEQQREFGRVVHPPVRGIDFVNCRGLPLHQNREREKEDSNHSEWASRKDGFHIAAEGKLGGAVQLLPSSSLEAHAERQLDFALAVETQAGNLPEVSAIVHVSIQLAELRCVEQVEEIATERYPEALGKDEALTYGQIHNLRARAGKWIPRRGARSAGCLGEGRRVKPLRRIVQLMQRTNHIWPCAGTAAVIADHINWETTGKSQNRAYLPAAQERIGSGVPIMAERATSAEWQFIESIEYEPMSHIETRVGALLGLPLERINWVAAVTVIAIKAGLRVVDGVRPGVGSAELNPIAQAAFHLRVHPVINGIATRVVDRNRAQQWIGFDPGAVGGTIHIVESRKMRPLGANVCECQGRLRVKLPLDLQVPLLHVGGSVLRQPARQADVGRAREVDI